jgi:CHASE2 domain-containing sensor protein
MSLGLVTDDDFFAELTSLRDSRPAKTLHKLKQARGNNIPVEIKKLAATSVLNGEPQTAVAEALAITAPTVNAAAQGMNTSNHDTRNAVPELLEHNSIIKNEIRSDATRVLTRALRAITDEKLDELSAPKAAEVARSMSGIVKDMSEEDNKPNNGIQVIIHVPRERSLDDFEVVEAGD